MDNLKQISESISLWWSELNYSQPLKKYLIMIAVAVVAISSFYILKPTENSSANVASPLVVDTVATEVTIDIQGAVVHPGVYTLGFGSRIIDAIKAAGGLSKNSDPSDINQARVVQDGEQIYIYAQSASKAVQGKPGVKTKPAGVISINQATAKQFESLNGIGPVLASKIVQYRKDHGPFSTIDELLNVPGIGPAKLAKMKSKLRA